MGNWNGTRKTLKTFFGKVKKGLSEKVSEIKLGGIAKFAAKEAAGAMKISRKMKKKSLEIRCN